MSGGYESWFVSARDAASPRALWIRHTRLRRRGEPELAALWCTVVDRDASPVPVVLKQVFDSFPPGAEAGSARFRGRAALDGRTAQWDLTIAAGAPSFRPLRPAVLYRAPLPRTKLVACVPDGLVSGDLAVDGHRVEIDQWRATVGHNWGTDHADSWVWLHAGGLSGAPEGWLDLVIARIRLGQARSPWMAMGAISLGGEPIRLGGLGRRVEVDARPDSLVASIPSAEGTLTLNVNASDQDTVALAYTDPSGGTRAVTHAAIATVKLTLHRRGEAELSMSASCAYEHGSAEGHPDLDLRPLPEG
jgi:hypothetical protein